MDEPRRLTWDLFFSDFVSPTFLPRVCLLTIVRAEQVRRHLIYFSFIPFLSFHPQARETDTTTQRREEEGSIIQRRRRPSSTQKGGKGDSTQKCKRKQHPHQGKFGKQHRPQRRTRTDSRQRERGGTTTSLHIAWLRGPWCRSSLIVHSVVSFCGPFLLVVTLH